jgi:enolase 1/2/3
MDAVTYRFDEIKAFEILDSRGRPTVQVTVHLSDGTSASAGVPSGASTGSGEALELRDGDPRRFGGAGVLKAVEHVRTELADLLVGRSWSSLQSVDAAMIDLDGTENKSRLGANALIGVSIATARAMAASDGVPLYRWLPGAHPRLPVPHFNVVNGGVHAPNQLAFQEFMLAPVGAASYAEALRVGAEVYQALRARLRDAGQPTGLGDEGGFAPDLATPEVVLEALVAAIGDAGYPAGRDGVAIALDPASSEFRQTDGRYYCAPGQMLDTDELIDLYVDLVDRYPIWSIEDGLAEDDWEGWEKLTARLGDRIQLVGDDIFVTNPVIISDAITRGVANSALIKPNQIGTVTETLAAIEVCRSAGYAQMISHRSGETTDTFIADLAVATGCGQIKSGAPARGERVAKYNRLLGIDAETPNTPFGLDY